MRSRHIPFAAFLIVVALQAAWSLRHPDYSWDAIPYMALLRSDASGGERDPAAVHAEVYGELQRVATADRYRELADGTEFRRTVHANPMSLQALLPFYRVKPLYLALAAVMRALGAHLGQALVLVSALGYVIAALVLWAWLSRTLAPLVALAVGVVLVVTPPLAPLAGLATPDAFSTALVLLAAWLLIDRDAPMGAAAVFAVSLLARTNNLIMGAALTIVWVLRDRERLLRRGAIGAAVLASGAGIVLAVNGWAGSYPWHVLIRHSFIGNMADPGADHSVLSLGTYVALLLRGVQGINYSTLGTPLLLLAAAAILPRSPAWVDQRVRAATALAGSVLVHFALFPALTDRYFVAQAIAINVLAISAIAGGAVGKVDHALRPARAALGDHLITALPVTAQRGR